MMRMLYKFYFILFTCLSFFACATGPALRSTMPQLNFSKPHGSGWTSTGGPIGGPNFSKDTPKGKYHTIVTYAESAKTDQAIYNLHELKNFVEQNSKEPRLVNKKIIIEEFHYSGRDCVKAEFIAEDHLVPYASPDNFFIIKGYDYFCLSAHEPGIIIHSSYSQRYLQDEKPAEGLEAEVEPFMRSIVYISSEGKDTPLIRAAKKGDISGVKKYLIEDVDINAKGTASDWGKTALIEAAHKGYADIVEILIKAGADINARDYYGDTALMLATDQEHDAIVKILLNAGSDVNAQNITRGSSALMAAARKDNAEIVKMLIDAGADVDIKDWSRSSALYIAAWNGSIPITKLLIDKGADVNIKNNLGLTALDMARLRKHKDIVELLKNAGTREKSRQ